ncbi:MAG: uroporphyrinogen-III C-methyltransferase [Xanthomonadales bacterium]|nr:uroporphyrinogen-III C-methyltransferase [Xanthomonadales bacterium]
METEQLKPEIDDLTSDPAMDRLLQEKKPASSGTAIAILALLVALAAVSASGWQWWQTRLVDPNAATQKDAITQLQNSQQQLVRSVESFENQLGKAQSPVSADELSRRNERLETAELQLAGLLGQTDEDQSSISAMQGSVRSLEQRLSATETGLVSVAAASQNSSAALDIAEIDFLLRTASERLQLFADPVSADLALQAADVQIEALNDPMYLSVRQRIAAARQALALVPVIDRVQLTAGITDLQSKASGLPFRGEVKAKPEPESPEDAGWWQSFKTTLSSLVTVKHRVPEDQSLLSLNDKDYLRQGLWLQFESARLALMRNDSGVYIDSLDRVNATVEQFFQSGAPEVEALLLGVATLKQANIAPEMPDISAPWTQLRQLRDSRRLLRSAAPVENVEPEE